MGVKRMIGKYRGGDGEGGGGLTITRYTGERKEACTEGV